MFKTSSEPYGTPYVKQIILLKEEKQENDKIIEKQQQKINKLTIEINKYLDQPNEINRLNLLIKNIRMENRSLIKERDDLKSKYNNSKYILKKMNLKNDAPVPYLVKKAVYERDNHTCLVCGATDNLTVDHIKPRIIGGTNHINNLQTLCQHCNLEKGTEVVDYRVHKIEPLIKRKKPDLNQFNFTRYDALYIEV